MRKKDFEKKKVYLIVLNALGYEFFSEKDLKDKLRCDVEDCLLSNFRFFIQGLLEDEDYEFGKETLSEMWWSFIQSCVRPKLDEMTAHYFGNEMFYFSDIKEIVNTEVATYIDAHGVTPNIYKTSFVI